MEYSELDSIVKQQLGISASEWHGLLIGYLSLTTEAALQTLPEDLLEVIKVCPDTATFVEDFAKTLSDLEGSLNLFLPNDSEDFKLRLQALKDWVRGYFAGLGLAGFSDHTFSDPEIGEVMQDLSDISEVDVNDIGDQDDELFYAEVYEYVKSVSLLIALTYHAQANSDSGSSDVDAGTDADTKPDDQPLH